MNKRVSVMKENTADLMGFDSPEVVLNHDPKSVLPFVQDMTNSDDPFEFQLQKTFQNIENSPYVPKESQTKSKVRFTLGDKYSPLAKENCTKSKLRLSSWLNESMMNELDTSYDLLNGTYHLNKTSSDSTLSSPLRRKSMSMGNLTTNGVPISFVRSQTEANKVAPREEMLSDMMPRLNYSTSSEDNSPFVPKEIKKKSKVRFTLGDENSPLVNKNLTNTKFRKFNWVNDSMLKELDTSYDLLNGTYKLDETVADHTFSLPLRRKSMSMKNLTTYGVPISFETIQTEANKVVSLLKDPQFLSNENPREEMLTEVMPRLNYSTSSEDELGLPKVLKLSIGSNTTTDFKESEVYKRYRKLSTSLQNISQEEILNTTIVKENNTTISDSICEDKKTTTTTEKPLKIESKIKLLQKGINVPTSLKTVKKPAEKTSLKKGPIKAFAPASQRLNNSNKPLIRPSTCPIRKTSNESNSSIIVPVASSTPDKKGLNLSNSRLIRPRSSSTTRIVTRSTAITKSSSTTHTVEPNTAITKSSATTHTVEPNTANTKSSATKRIVAPNTRSSSTTRNVAPKTAITKSSTTRIVSSKRLLKDHV